MLHQKSTLKAVKEIVCSRMNLKDILSLLLIASKFENKLT